MRPRRRHAAPPRSRQTTNDLLLRRLWQALPTPDRQQTLRLLSRVVAQQLPRLTAAKGAGHEQV